jgi:mannose/fructose-specific phosphotransferase system component IIA
MSTPQMYTPEVLRKAALEYKIIAGKNLAELLNLPDETKTDNIVKFVDSIVHAAVLEVTSLVQQAGQIATDINTVQKLQNE